ncbi:hypothetical protein EVAR_93630_1 [Eumeta japonica]|uniref:Uncharacterized protein n=1 Tax=Eumeta variegata TaxID=151549 RepID=A0A4C1TQK0_EUMVA|nr:hypothetical protein EVAR_93630_1 [Eumeta japonica]
MCAVHMCAIYKLQWNWCICRNCNPTSTSEARAVINKSENQNAVHHFAHILQESILRADCAGKSEVRAYAAVLKLPLQKEAEKPGAVYRSVHLKEKIQQKRTPYKSTRIRCPRLKNKLNTRARRRLAVVVRDYRGAAQEETIDHASANMNNLRHFSYDAEPLHTSRRRC